MQRNISIVEDEDILLKIVKNYLLDDGYEVLEVTDGKEALSIFKEHEGAFNYSRYYVTRIR